MGWDGSGNFNRTDGTRTGASVWDDAKAAGVKILSNDHDTHDEDIATGLENCVTRDGQNAATSDLPMGGNRHTGVADANARDTYASAADVQDNALVYAAATGSSGAYAVTLAPAVTAYVAGLRVVFKANHTNSSNTATLNVNGLGAKDLQDTNGDDYIKNTVKNGQVIEAIYDGTQFRTTKPRFSDWIDVSSTVSFSTQPGSQTFTGASVSIATYQLTGRVVHFILDVSGTISNPSTKFQVESLFDLFDATGDILTGAGRIDTQSGTCFVEANDRIAFFRYDTATLPSGSVGVRLTGTCRTSA